MIIYTRVSLTGFMKSIYLIPLLIVLSSCSFFSSNESGTYIKSTNYLNSIEKNLPVNWISLKTEGADFAISNRKSNSVFLINSACRKYEASSLNALSSSLLSGIEDINIISRININLHEREAQELRFSGSVDGVKTFVNITTLQKNFCIYDFVMISKSLKKLEEDYNQYKVFISQVKLE
jgi:hypothetical protein